MIVYRLRRSNRIALDGVGGLFADERWHPKGHRIVYAAASVSLAVLEVGAHHPAVPRGWVSLSIEIDDAQVSRLDSRSFEAPDWAEDRTITQAMGDTWLRDRSSPVLAVPSVIVRTEWNYLINPEHPEAAQIAVRSVTPFEFDPRLFSTRVR